MPGRGWFVVPAALAACGRVAFDPRSDALVTSVTDTSPDAPGLGTLGGVCAFASLTVIDGGTLVDDTMAASLPAAISQGCATNPAVQIVGESAPGVLDPVTFRPLFAAGELGIGAGGPVSQHAMMYLDTADTPVQLLGDATNIGFVERATGAMLLTVTRSSLTATHQIGTVMFVCDPDVPPCFLSIYGQASAGTVAAGYLFVHTIAPSLRTESHRWYVFEWFNGDGDPNPSAGDTLTVVASGS